MAQGCSSIRYGLLFVVAWAMIGLAGCHDQRPDKSQLAPVEYFRQTQAHTETPDGRILTSTVREVAPYLLEYQTDSGQTYQVRYSSQGEGFRYYDSRRIEPAGASAGLE